MHSISHKYLPPRSYRTAHYFKLCVCVKPKESTSASYFYIKKCACMCMYMCPILSSYNLSSQDRQNANEVNAYMDTQEF